MDARLRGLVLILPATRSQKQVQSESHRELGAQIIEAP